MSWECTGCSTVSIAEELMDNPILGAVDIIHQRNQVLSTQDEEKGE